MVKTISHLGHFASALLGLLSIATAAARGYGHVAASAFVGPSSRSSPQATNHRHLPLLPPGRVGNCRACPHSVLYSSKDASLSASGRGDDEVAPSSSNNKKDDATKNSSKREMLKFAIPALGIYLTNPLLSNIDNAFVGRTVGALGLAALSPATLCIDQVLYLFSFLSRAATQLAARGYNDVANASEAEAKGRMKEAASPALSVAVVCGLLMSALYAVSASSILKTLKVDPLLHASATSYIHWRGMVAPAAMAQSILLTLFIVAKDAVTPLKIIAGAALLNIIGDAAFCVWPLQTGCAGAAAATALATLVGTGWMARALKKRDMLPRLKLPNGKECRALLEFTGPLLAITLTRMAGFMNMQRRAMTLGTEALAGYQVCANLLIFFILFGEPLSQIGQTKLPSLIDAGDTTEARATFRSLLVLSTFAAVGVGAAACLAAWAGPGLFSSDVAVQAVARAAAPTLFFAVSQTIVGIAVDGALMASRDFSFMLAVGVASFLLQAKLLTQCHSVAGIFATFTIRLGTYAVLSVGRVLLGYGNLGKVIRGKGGNDRAKSPAKAQ